MGEVVINGARLGVRGRAAAELVSRAAALVTEEEDRALLTAPAAQMSLSFDALPPAQARRVARAVDTVAEQLKQEHGMPGAPAEDVEIAAQMTALRILFGKVYGSA